MKILVTGANGLLGSNIVCELNRRNIAVRIVVREKANLAGLNGSDYEKVVGSITNKEVIQQAIQGCDVVIHVAANTVPVPNRKKYFTAINVEATRLLVEACIDQGIKKFIHISTANTIGYGNRKNPATEGQPMTGLFRHSAYAATKKVGENIVLEAAKSGRLNAVILNPTFLIGPLDSKPSSGRVLGLYRGKKYAFITRGGKNFVHSGDVAFATCEAISKGRSGERYLLCNENLTYKEFYYLLKEITNDGFKVVVLPSKLFRFGGLISSIIEWVHPHFGFNFNFSSILCIRNWYSSEKARKELNMPQTPVRVAIIDALEWFKQNNYFEDLK